jgi:hypothetical protein
MVSQYQGQSGEGMASDWKDYQEEAASFFRDLGLEADTDVSIKGVRTTHDIDVYVKSHQVGFDIVWLIECKYWKRPVTKLHVLALREIVTDVGADRGILLSESGVQSGAKEAATLTNVHISSLASLRSTASAEFIAMSLRELFDRVEACRERYWNIPKEQRINCGLRPDVGAGGYAGDQIINLCSELLARAFRGTYPIELDSLAGLMIAGVGRQFFEVGELLSFVEAKTAELESKIDACLSEEAENDSPTF